eukprot:4762581-Pyramimonas_sp.AAC.1
MAGRQSTPGLVKSRWPLRLARPMPGGDEVLAPESTVGRPMAVCRQEIYVEYSMGYSRCRALNGTLVSTVDDCRLLN